MKLKTIIFSVLIWKIIFLIFASIGTYLIAMNNDFSALAFWAKELKELPYLVWVWGNYDGVHYMNVAKWGYDVTRLPFMPLYPLSMYAFVWIFRQPHLVAGQIISLMALIGSLILFYKILKQDKRTGLFNLLILCLLSFPTSFYLSSVYNDSLFLFFATLTLYFGRKKKWLSASVAGALATLTRINGLALIFYLIFEYLQSNLVDPTKTWQLNLKKMKQDIFSALINLRTYLFLLIPIAFIGYLIYIQFNFGDWTLIFKAMKNWRQDHAVIPFIVFWRYFKIIFLTPNKMVMSYAIAVFESISFGFYVFLLIYSFKKIRLSYWIFVVFSLLIPVLTGTLQGMPRYGLHLYPIFLSLAMWLNQRKLWVKVIYFSISTILAFIAAVLFTRGYFVA